jgi:hypothetical protein
MTEADVLALLRARFTKSGNGGNGEFCFLEKVRNGAAFNANRTLDAVAIALWPSRGLTIDGFEVKVSRSDWQRELAQPDKAEDACKLVDRFSIVAPRGVVLDGELPATWGLLEVAGKRLVTTKAAPSLRPPVPARLSTISRDFLVGILRSIPAAVPRVTAEGELRAAERKGHDEGYKASQEQRQDAERRAREAEQALSTFGDILGMDLRTGWGLRGVARSSEQLAEIGAGLRAVLSGDKAVEQARSRVASVVRQLRDEADRIEKGERW